LGFSTKTTPAAALCSTEIKTTNHKWLNVHAAYSISHIRFRPNKCSTAGSFGVNFPSQQVNFLCFKSSCPIFASLFILFHHGNHPKNIHSSLIPLFKNPCIF